MANVDINTELKRTQPDFVVYVPKSIDGITGDTGNEHFLVFDAPDESLFAIWTQSTFEGKDDQRIVFSKSFDKGVTWSRPRQIAGRNVQTNTMMASWGFPIISQSGRIYVIYNKHIGINDIFSHTTGKMAGVYSDDCGQSWSAEQEIEFPKDAKWDNPDSNVPANWIVWQKPERLSEGKYYAGFTRWVSPKVRKPAPIRVWWAEAAVIEFMRFENIDDNPEPKDLEISFFMTGDDALQVPLIGHDDVPVAQEPSIVKLPDNRLFCVMRTTQGSPYYSISNDEGESWSKPSVLLFGDNSDRVLHPCSPCPIYEIGQGKYVFFYHNHDGHFQQWGPKDTLYHRRPIMMSLGEFTPDATQPIRFTKPVFVMDNDGVALGANGGRCDLAMYASLTKIDDEPVLWYPERKFFLLGKKLGKYINKCALL